MNTQQRFERWLASDYPEADTAKLDNGNYRNSAVQSQWRTWQGCCREWLQAMEVRDLDA